MEGESAVTTINDIPDEMLKEIFKYFPTEPVLLESARLVSRKWNTNATSICRHRFVNLSKPGILDMTEILKIFTDSRNVPWSSVTFPRINPLPSPTDYPLRVLRDFGVHVWRLKSDNQHWDNLLHFLQSIPNLRALVLKSSDSSFSKVSTSLNLPLLKCLKINITAESLDFLYFLLNSSAVRLDKIKLRVELPTVHVETARKLMSLLNTFSIPNIFLKIVSWPDSHEGEVMKVIAAGKLKLQKLNLRFGEPWPDTTTFLLAVVGHILAASCQSLRSLKMTCNMGTGKCTTALQFPILSALKVLKFRFCDNMVPTSKEFTGHLFSFVETKHFPVLQKVSMKYEMPDSVQEDVPAIFNSNLCKFETVTELESECWESGLAADWFGLFPNVKKLTADVTHKSLVFILKNMHNLEYLDLCLHGDGNRRYSVNLNSMLSGIPGADEVYEENEELIVKLRAIYGRPSLLSLPLLTTFKFNCASDAATVLSDSGAYLSILPLQPLDLLCLTNAVLSTECIARLRERHRVVVVEDDLSQEYKARLRERHRVVQLQINEA